MAEYRLFMQCCRDLAARDVRPCNHFLCCSSPLAMLQHGHHALLSHAHLQSCMHAMLRKTCCVFSTRTTAFTLLFQPCMHLDAQKECSISTVYISARHCSSERTYYAADQLLQQLMPIMADHSSSDCRQQYFEILRTAWQLRPAMHAMLRPALVAMLGDSNAGLRAEALGFWDSALPRHVGQRLQALLEDSLTDPGALVQSSTPCLLAMMLASSKRHALLLQL